MEQKNTLDKIMNRHKFYGSLKEDTELTINDFDIIRNNVDLYLEDIKSNKYNFTLEELCNLLSITKMYANTYFLDKLDTLYITRSCKLLMYSLRSKDTRQIKQFVALFKKEDKKAIAQMLSFSDADSFKSKLKTLNLDKERLTKKYFISENSIKDAIKQVFKKEIRTRLTIEDEEIIETNYTDIDDNLVNEILNVGLVDANALKKYFEFKSDMQLHRLLNQFEELEQLRIVVINNNEKKANTVRYINNIEIIQSVKRALKLEKEENRRIAEERYEREKLI